MILSSLILMVGLLSGSFPSFVLSGFKPVDIFNNRFKFSGKNVFTKVLLTLQISISIFLLVTTIIMGKQIRYMKQHELGFDKEGMIFISTYADNPGQGDMLVKLFKEKVKSYPSIVNVTGSFSSFNNRLTFGGSPRLPFSTFTNRVYYDYINTTGLKLTQGRDFSPAFTADTLAAIVNQKFVDKLEVDNPIGYTFEARIWGEIHFKIIGVIENYNFQSLNQGIEPVYLQISKRQPLNYILVKITNRNIPETMKLLEETWKKIQPHKPFTCRFVEDEINSAYARYNRWNRIVNFTTVFAFLITSIGIFCLSNLSVSKRIKEIGIRKVLGASFIQIYKLLIKNMILILIISNLISLPVAWFFTKNWLQNFAYRIDIGFPVFVLSGLISLLIVFLNVSYHSVKVTFTNPTDSLRNE